MRLPSCLGGCHQGRTPCPTAQICTARTTILTRRPGLLAWAWRNPVQTLWAFLGIAWGSYFAYLALAIWLTRGT